MKFFAILGLALAANSMLASGLALKGSHAPRLSAQTQQQEALSQISLSDSQQEEQPMPYQFNYEAQSEGGSSSRSEVADGTGKVLGQYSIKGADGISRTVSYSADSDGFKANISTNEPGTESQNPSFIVLNSSQLPAAEISRQLQTEQDLNSQQEEQPQEEAAAELPSKSISASPRKQPASAPVKSRRPAQQPQRQQPAAVRPAQVNVPVKSRRPAQLPQQQLPLAPAPVSAPPSKRPAAPISKGNAIRSRGPAKAPAALPTTSRPAAPAKRPIQLQPQLQQPALQEEEQEAAPLNQSQEEAEDDSQEGF